MNILYNKTAVSCMVYNAEKGPPTIFTKADVSWVSSRIHCIECLQNHA